MTTVIFQRCDGKPAGDPIDLPRARRPLLSALAKKHADRSRPHIVCVYRRGEPWAPTDFSVRLRKTWRHTRIGPSDTVAIIYAPRGGGGGAAGGSRAGKAAGIGLIVATIALAAIGQFWAIGALNGAMGLAATSAVGGAIWAAGSAALLAGAGYLLSRATRPKANKDDNSRPLYGVSGGGNLARLGDRIPVIYGRCWTTPDLSQPDYTTFEGDNQTLYKRMTVGLGSYAVKTIRVGSAVMWTATGGVQAPFIGASVEVIAPGAMSWLVPAQVATAPAVASLEVPRVTDTPQNAGPFSFPADTPPQSRVQLDWSLPQGIYAVGTGNFAGKQYPTDWGVHFEYAPCDEDGTVTGDWATLYVENGRTMTTKPRRVTTLVDIPAGAGRYAYRARNLGAPPVVNGSDIVNTVFWEGLRSHIPETIVRDHVTEIAIRVSSGPGLGVTAFANVEVEVQRLLPVWNGVTWTLEETRKAVWAAVDALANTSYGAGLDHAQIDLPRFLHYASTVIAYDTYDGVIRGPVSVYEALSTVLGVMRASPLRLGNVWSMVRDDQKLVRKHVITRRQILKDSHGQQFNLDLSDGSANVIVEWSAGGDPKRQRDERVNFGAVTNAPRRMRAEGVSTTEHAIHIATWAASTAYRRRERRTFTMELAGRLILPNDKCSIDAWYFDGKEAVGIVAHSGLNLTLDQPLALPGTPTFGVLRARDGREWGPVQLTQVDDSTVAMNADDVAAAQSQTGLTIAQVINTATQAMTSMTVGALDVVTDSWLVRSIRFSGESQVEIEAIIDDPGVWTDLGEAIIGPPPPPSSGLVNQAAIDIVYISATAAQRGTQMYMDWSAGRPRVPVNYVVRISYDDWETYEDAYHGPQSSGSYPVQDTNGFIKVRAFAYSADGQRSAIRETQFTAPQAVISGQTARVRIDYEELMAGIRYRTSLIPELSDLFDLVAEGQVEAFQGKRLAETGIRRTEQVKTELTTALAATRTQLSATIDANKADVDTKIVALVDEDEALAARQDDFDVEFGQTKAALQQEIVTRATETQAIAQQFIAMNASVNGRFASVSSGMQALSNQQGAFAQQMAELNVAFGGFSAGGKVQFAAVAAPAGVFARYSVVLNASNGNSYESGLYYELIQSGGGFYSQFFIDASRFYIGNPLTRTVPFSVVDGVTYIDNAVIRSGTLSRHASAEGSTTVAAPIPVQPGGRVTVLAVYTGGQQLANGGAAYLHLYRSGSWLKSQLVSLAQIPVSGGSNLSTYGTTIVQASYDTDQAGTETISAVLGAAASPTSSLQLSGLTMQVSSYMK
jgi:hypothetical protein